MKPYMMDSFFTDRHKSKRSVNFISSSVTPVEIPFDASVEITNPGFQFIVFLTAARKSSSSTMCNSVCICFLKPI